MYKTIFVLVLTMAGMQWPAAAQDLSHKGKSFWIVYPAPIEDVQLVLHFGAGNRPATVTVTAQWESGSQQKVYTVPANTVISSASIPINIALADAADREKIFNRSIHIESDVPIVAYAHYYQTQYSGGTLLIPEETWGYSYLSMDSPDDHNGFVCIMASHDNTRVEITPATVTSLGKPANIPFVVNLNKGQVYQFIAGSGELSGSSIRSVDNGAGGCFPIGVLSGSLGAPICGMTSDFIINQLFPYQAWGKHYLTAPFSSSLSGGNSFNTAIYRVQVKDPATVVKLNGIALTGLTNNLFYEYRSNTADYIEADQPVMVVQFMTSQSTNGGNCTFYGIGDPEMITLSPLEQSASRSDFYLPYQGDILYNYLTLVVPAAGLASLKIDGSSTFNFVYAHPKLPGYAVVIKRWIAAGKSCTVTSDSAFTGISYGLAPWNSYGFNITSLKNLAGTVELSNKPDAGVLKDSTCTGMLCKLVYKTAYPPTRIEWELGNVPGLLPNADVVLTAPVPDSTVTAYGNIYYVYSTPLYYTFTTPGIVTVPVLVTTPSTDNCDHTQTYTGYLNVNASPVAAFTGPAVVCIPDGKAVFSNQSSYTGTGAALQYQWSFGDGTGAATISPVHYYTSAATLPVQLIVLAPDGCSDTARHVLLFGGRPKAGFSVSDSTLCGSGTIVFTDRSLSPGSGTGNWYWSMGDGSSSTQVSPIKQYSQPGSYTVQEYVKNKEGCLSDTAVKTIQVYALPQVDAGPDMIIQQGGSVKLQGRADAGATVQWSPSTGLDAVNTFMPLAAPPANQLYYLTATSSEQCIAWDSVWVHVLLRLRIPNAFSPNGDGINDVWEIPGLSSYTNATVQVFNRWGQKVFESRGYSRPWDGTTGGRRLPTGVYYYIINAGYKTPQQAGSLTIVP